MELEDLKSGLPRTNPDSGGVDDTVHCFIRFPKTLKLVKGILRSLF